MPHCCGPADGREKKVLTVNGMTCDHCKMTVTNALKRINGVSDVVVDLGSKKVSVSYDARIVREQSLEKAITDAGYQVI